MGETVTLRHESRRKMHNEALKLLENGEGYALGVLTCVAFVLHAPKCGVSWHIGGCNMPPRTVGPQL